MTPIEILNFILEKENLNPNRLSKMLGYERAQAVYDIKKGKAKSISSDFANRVIKTFPNSGYTLAFLLTGDEQLLETFPFEETEIQDNANMIGDRIKKIMSEKNCSVNSFAAMIGVRQNTLSQQLTGDRKISLNIVQKIALSFDDIDIHWILTGKGPMLKSESQPTTSLPPPTEGFLSDREELKKKDETIKLLTSQVEFLEEIIKMKESMIVNKDFQIREKDKRIKFLEEANNKKVAKKSKSDSA